MHPLVFLLALGLTACAPSVSSPPGLAPPDSLDRFACEGCEAASERDPAALTDRLVLAPPSEPGARLRLAGRVLTAEGDPASGVVLYIHQTNAAGRYDADPEATGWARRHGRLRGWLVTGPDGSYSVETVRPGAYPGRGVPAHVHVFVQEPGRPPYYLNDFTFTDDPLVTPAYRAGLQGPDGIVALIRDPDGTWIGRRDLRLLP